MTKSKQELDTLKTMVEVAVADQLIAYEQQQVEREERHFSEQMEMLSTILRQCQRDTPKPATDKPTAVTAEPPTTPQPPHNHPTSGSCALLILGDSIVKSLSTNGMEKLTKKGTTIITTGGATVSCHGDDIRRDDSQWDDTTGMIASQTTYHGDDSQADDI